MSFSYLSKLKALWLLILIPVLQNCTTEQKAEISFEETDKPFIILEFEKSNKIVGDHEIRDNSLVLNSVEASAEYEIDIPVAGRYRVEVLGKSITDKAIVWIEDYVGNKDDRTYNITSDLELANGPDSELMVISKDGSPLNKGIHKIRLHLKEGGAILDKVRFTLLKTHVRTPTTLEQTMNGDSLELVWSDEFEGSGLPDTTKWTYDLGNWGWGNGELQYYTENRIENARLENGNLIIEAIKDDMGEKWTSARLTTRGKVSFLYGRIEFRAMVPPYKGNWAAGWTLGDEYVDELSWPYCGEIDILESVGYEMNDTTGTGVAHASAHCAAYYFKLGNQPTGITDVDSMYQKYHTYAVDWSPGGITASVDGNTYFTYNDTTSEMSWPFAKSQNIILNLAMGGGWGGAEGMDPNVTSQKMVLDYVRVYSLK